MTPEDLRHVPIGLLVRSIAIQLVMANTDPDIRESLKRKSLKIDEIKEIAEHQKHRAQLALDQIALLNGGEA